MIIGIISSNKGVVQVLSKISCLRVHKTLSFKGIVNYLGSIVVVALLVGGVLHVSKCCQMKLMEFQVRPNSKLDNLSKLMLTIALDLD